MEALSFIDTLFSDWKLLASAFAIGAFYYQAKTAIKKIMSGIETTSNTHAEQNIILDNISENIEKLDKRMSRLEGSIDMITINGHEQSVRLSVIETRQDFEDGNAPSKRRARRTQ